MRMTDTFADAGMSDALKMASADCTLETTPNSAPIFTSANTFTVNENSVLVGTITADDVDGGSLSYTIAHNEAIDASNTGYYSLAAYYDGLKFWLDSATGVLRFETAPNYEVRTDHGYNNVFDVLLKVTDQSGAYSFQMITINVANVNEGLYISSGGGGATATVTAAENQTYVTTVVARDYTGPSVTYSISGGYDASRFTIDAQTGVLSFINGPNYESPNDFGLNREYEVTVRATDGTITDTQALKINLTDVNEPVSIQTGGGGDIGYYTAQENSNGVQLIVDNPDQTALTYTIIGGADASLFSIANGGATYAGLGFIYPYPDFETPRDANQDNVYEVTFSVSDGTFTDTQTAFVTVANVNEVPYISNASTQNIYENQTYVTRIVASDPENAALTYSIAGGSDAARFQIDAITGDLSLIEPANYEVKSSYNVTVRASDGATSTTKSIYVGINNVNEVPAIFGGDSASYILQENQTIVTAIYSSDPEGTARIYSIAGGADAALFKINTSTGLLSFIQARDFESPADYNGDNIYDVVVRASDGALYDEQSVSVRVTNANEGVSFTSSNAFQRTENESNVGSVVAVDADGGAVAYSITGGADASLFTINQTTGTLSFVTAPDFEGPSDADGNNVYIVAVSATDGSFTATHNVSVTVSGVNEAPSFSSAGGHKITENTTLIATVAATDIDGDAITYSILGGADAAGFAIDGQTGALSFLTAPDHDVPADTDGDNIYDVVIQASDGPLSVSQVLSIVVEDINEAPSLFGPTTGVVNVSEGSFAVYDFAGSDPEGAALTYSIDRDQADDNWAFIIDPDSGQLSFILAPDYENLSTLDGDAYHLTVQVSDGTTKVSQNIEVRVTNINEDLTITSNGAGSNAALSVAENSSAVTQVQAVDQDGTAAAYSIVGGADAARFTINAATGQLAFINAPNREAPTDAGGNNVYDVIVQASDGQFVGQQALAITVTNVNEGLAITSNGGGTTAQLAVTENSNAVTQVQAVDQDGTASTYSIVGGADAAHFAINAQTGQLVFVNAPNHEVPTDADGNNVYDVIVQASDGQFTDQQALSVSIINVNEGVTITGTSKANTISTTTTVSGQSRATALEDTIYGLGGNDSLYGGDGADYIDGGTGNDNLYGQGGADLLLGGSGADRFIFQNISDSQGANIDTIFDFNKAETDRISLSAVDANIYASGDQSFSFIGTNAFTGAARQLRYQQSDGDTWVSGDVNGDGVADFQIRLLGAHNLTSTDFIL